MKILIVIISLITSPSSRTGISHSTKVTNPRNISINQTTSLNNQDSNILTNNNQLYNPRGLVAINHQVPHLLHNH